MAEGTTDDAGASVTVTRLVRGRFWAALAGLLVLNQRLGAWEWAGIGLIVVSNVVVSVRSQSPRPLVVV